MRRLNQNPILFVLLLAASLALLQACGAKPDQSAALAPAAYEAMDTELLSSRSNAGSPAAAVSPPGSDTANFQTVADNPAPATVGRKLIHTESLSLEVSDTAKAGEALKALAESHGAYIEHSYHARSGSSFRIRVPVAALEAFMAAGKTLGTIIEQSSSVEDVTDQYWDLDGRLRNKRLLEERYRAYLGKASNIEEILQTERALSELTTEIEWLEGSFRDLGSRIALATVHVSLVPERPLDENTGSFGRAFRNLVGNFGRAMKTAALALIALVLYGIPLVLLLALLWWLLFGKIGALRHLFALVSRRKER